MAMNTLLETRRAQMFPKLTAAQIARLEVHGQRVETSAGTVLVQAGDRHRKLLVVLAGSLEILLPGAAGYELMIRLEPGDFTGEMSTLRGVAGIGRIRVRDAGAVLAIDDQDLRNIVQTDAELSELFMRAFILRRMGIVSGGNSDITLLGSSHSANTLRLREFLTRNSYPYISVDIDSDPGVQALLERFHVAVEDIPIVICRGAQVFKNPSNHELAECLGMNLQLDSAVVHDVIVVGAGPAGLAAAVYGASEGLDVLVLEANAPGGQAGSSSRIENYLGFPTGISGQALAGRALVQSQKFGANVSIANAAVRLRCDRRPYEIELADGQSMRTHTVIIASGAQYRRLPLENLERFSGVGVYYAATFLEARLCQGEDIVVVGGGNSAGQAAVFLAGSCRHVHMMVRAGGLAESMSRYLIRRIEENPHITLHTQTQLVALAGTDRLESVSWRSGTDDQEQTRAIGHVFLMTGAVPNTRWLQDCVALDDKGFVRTGSDLHAADLEAAGWPLHRTPHLQETSLPGVFAVGDVRSGSVKRIASAVGEGSICVQFVHRALQELAIASQQRSAVR
ncbi:MAG TPA: FAD-dependent oxidoreductase [Steroidobacteraceae bacterium]|jgi:thioredoxin reductase (NADPH)